MLVVLVDVITITIITINGSRSDCNIDKDIGDSRRNGNRINSDN